MSHTTITKVQGFEVLDSRGNPTVRVEVTLQSGAIGIAAVPSGASTGGHEACEKRDRDPSRYGGKGVRAAVRAVNDELARALIGRDAAEQKTIDRILCETDGTGDKSNLGANAILGVSLAVAHAAAAACRLPLWQYLTRFTGRRPALPRPMMNILNGGRHAPNNIDIQEFMVIPLGCPTFADGLERCVRVTHRLGALLEEAGLACGVGDEGGFAPRLKNEEQALELILRAIEDCRLRPGEDMALALDAAAGEWQTGNNVYLLPKENRLRTPHDLLEYWRRLTAKYPIISLEDPAGEDDWDLWRQLTEAIGKNVQLVGDDLFVTQKARLEQGLARRAANAVLIKPNPDRNAGNGGAGAAVRLWGHPQPPQRRNGGHHHRRPGGSHRLRPDQNRCPLPQRAHRQVQPPPPHRGHAGGNGLTPHGRSVFRQSPSHICAGTGSGQQGKPPFGRFLGRPQAAPYGAAQRRRPCGPPYSLQATGSGGRNPPKSSFGRFGLRPPFPSQKSQKGAPPTGKGAPFLFIRLTATFSGGNTVPTAPPPLPPLR